MFDAKLLYPPFARKLIVFEAKLAARKLPFYPFQGVRTFDEQLALWKQGRTENGVVFDKSKVVTNARPGFSIHQYACAADYVEDGMIEKPGVQWSWNIKADLNQDGANDWLQMAETAKECGLEAGYFWPNFPDAPHIQLAGLPPVKQLYELYKRGGLSLVWAELDRSFDFSEV